MADCSTVVDALLGDPPAQDALRGGGRVHVPHLLDAEFTSALRGLALGGHLTPQRASAAFGDLDAAPLRRWPLTDSLRRRAFALRTTITAYDAIYVALAEELDCPLVTRDATLARVRGHCAEIVLV